MSFRNENNKRKPPWSNYNGSDGKRRPQGRYEPKGGYSRWDHQPHSSSAHHHHPGRNNAWRHRIPLPYHYDHSKHSSERIKDSSHDFAHKAPQDYTEVELAGLEAEKRDKILATKKRLEEALASKPQSVTSDIQRYNGDSTVPESSKPLDTNSRLVELECQDFKLTNSDFKEIGSVEPVCSSTGVGEVEGEEGGQAVAAPCPSQQRSFDNTYIAPSHKASPPSKSPRLGGWSIDQLDENVRQHENGRTRARGQVYIQESTERILGPTQHQIESVERVDKPSAKTHSQPSAKQPLSNPSRVGKLYQSFLKSRLSGYTPKVKGTMPRPVGANPFLDMSSMLSGQIELEMPVVLVKAETNGSTEHLSTAQEANEFCKEFGFLLSYPNLLISQDDLERLGLSHLSEMNNMIDTSLKINGDTGPLDNPSSDNLNVPNETNRTLEKNSSRNNPTAENVSGRQEVIQENLINGRGALRQSSIETTSDAYNLGTTENKVSVESIVKTVLEKMTQPTRSNSHLPIDGFNIQYSSFQQSSSGQMPSNSTNNNKMEDISKKILNLFVIDKQIQELMDQKHKIYSELFSSKDISFTLFNNWAKDQVLQGRVLNSTAASGPQNLNEENQELNFPQNDFAEESFQDKTIYETISELQSLKQEIKALKGSSSENLIEGENVANLNSAETQVAPPVPEKPKLSVRKDLIDPSVVCIPNSLNPEINLANEAPNLHANEAPVEVQNEQPESSKKVIKNKSNKSKRKEKPCVETIDLIDDTSSDEDGRGGGSEASGPLREEPELVPSPRKGKTNNKSFDMRKNTATCITTLRKALIVGCQEGFLMVFSLENGDSAVFTKLHAAAILSIHTVMEQRCVITGSADSTVCLFSLQENVVKQQIKIQSPIQCIDVNFKRMFIGTMNGFLFTCRIKTQLSAKNSEDHPIPLKSAECLRIVLKDDPLQVSHSNIMAVKAAKEGARKVIIVASRGENITVRDTNTGLLLRMFDWIDTVYCLETYNETPLVFCGTSSQSVRIVNFTTGENAEDCLLGRSIIQISFLDTVMFAASFDGQIYIYDVQEKRLLHILNAFKNKCLITSLTVIKTKILVANNKHDVHALPFPAELKSHIKKKKKVVCES